MPAVGGKHPSHIRSRQKPDVRIPPCFLFKLTLRPFDDSFPGENLETRSQIEMIRQRENERRVASSNPGNFSKETIYIGYMLENIKCKYHIKKSIIERKAFFNRTMCNFNAAFFGFAQSFLRTVQTEHGMLLRERLGDPSIGAPDIEHAKTSACGKNADDLLERSAILMSMRVPLNHRDSIPQTAPPAYAGGAAAKKLLFSNHIF